MSYLAIRIIATIQVFACPAPNTDLRADTENRL